MLCANTFGTFRASSRHSDGLLYSLSLSFTVLTTRILADEPKPVRMGRCPFGSVYGVASVPIDVTAMKRYLRALAIGHQTCLLIVVATLLAVVASVLVTIGKSRPERSRGTIVIGWKPFVTRWW